MKTNGMKLHFVKCKRMLATLCAIPLLLMTASLQPPVKPPARPNIIYIMADDLGYSDIGCYGGEVQTPNLDKLAAGGLKLRTFYNNARCCPTRASLLTGQYPHAVGVGHMVSLANAKYEAGPYQGFLDPSKATIAEALQKAGYATYMSGKWHVGERREHWPRKRGFDRYFGLISGASSFYEVTPAEKDKRFYALDDDIYTIPQEGYYATDAFTDQAIGFLKEHAANRKKDPFFLYLAYTAPHFPLHALEPDIAKYEKLYAAGWDSIRNFRYQGMKKVGYIDARYPLSARTKGIPNWKDQGDKEQWVRRMAVYAAMTDRMDQNIGRLVAALKASGQYENTLIVFLSDNGGCAETVNTQNRHDPSKKIGEKGSYSALEEAWANVTNTPFRMYKHYMHEGGINTPFIVHWPAGIKPRKGFSDGVGHVMDLMPTALELAGAPDASLPGQSLSYLWSKGPLPDRSYCWEHEGNKAIRKGSWKLVRDHDDAGWELYDMQTDPVELNNLAASQPDRARSMLNEYLAWEKKVGVKPFTGKAYGSK